MEERHLHSISQLHATDLRAIMETYGEDVWNFAYFLTKKHDLADDIAQDVFIKVYKHIGLFRGESSLKTWLLKLTRNTAISYTRLAFFRRRSPYEPSLLHQSGASAEEAYLQQQYEGQVWELVLGLPLKLREIMILRAHYQLSHEEIAHTLAISLGTVKSRLHRARAKLSKQLHREGAE